MVVSAKPFGKMRGVRRDEADAEEDGAGGGDEGRGEIDLADGGGAGDEDLVGREDGDAVRRWRRWARRWP